MNIMEELFGVDCLDDDLWYRTFEVVDVKKYIETFGEDTNVVDNIMEHGLFYKGKLFFHVADSGRVDRTGSYFRVMPEVVYDLFVENVDDYCEETYGDGNIFRDCADHILAEWFEPEDENKAPCITEEEYYELDEVNSRGFEMDSIMFEQLPEEEQEYYYNLFKLTQNNP